MDNDNVENIINKLTLDIGVLENYLNHIPKSPIYETEKCFELELVKDLHLATSVLKQQLNYKWISVNNRSPSEEECKKYRGEFIIQDNEVDIPYTAIWNRIKKVWQSEDGYTIHTIVAWQVLPDLYV